MYPVVCVGRPGVSLASWWRTAGPRSLLTPLQLPLGRHSGCTILTLHEPIGSSSWVYLPITSFKSFWRQSYKGAQRLPRTLAKFLMSFPMDPRGGHEQGSPIGLAVGCRTMLPSAGVGTRWSLRFLPTQTILWFLEGQVPKAEKFLGDKT